MQGHGRHLLFYAIMRRLVGPPIRWLLKYRPITIPMIQGPCIVVANHNTDYDAIVLGMSFPKHMYFVASEHIFRVWWVRTLLLFFLNPIPKRKGGADVRTAMQMARRFRAGDSVGLFAEGNKSFDGLTCPVHPATGSMVKASGATLVTYRLEGGYFTSPRWAHTLRRGRMRGSPVGIYPPERIRKMTPNEVNALIARDIREDAYERQRKDPVRFRGRRLAEGIGNALYLCPRCRAYGTVTGKDDRIICGCGLSLTYTETGELAGDTPFATMKAWGNWQREELRAALTERPKEIPFSDENQIILKIHADHRAERIAEGTLSICADGLVCGAFRLSIQEISGLEIYGRNTIVFSDDQGYRYQVLSPAERSGLKYFEAYGILRQGGD